MKKRLRTWNISCRVQLAAASAPDKDGGRRGNSSAELSTIQRSAAKYHPRLERLCSGIHVCRRRTQDFVSATVGLGSRLAHHFPLRLAKPHAINFDIVNTNNVFVSLI